MQTPQATTPPSPGADREEPELANEADIPSDGNSASASEPPKPANPEPTSAPDDPEKGRVPTPDPVKPEHPRQ